MPNNDERHQGARVDSPAATQAGEQITRTALGAGIAGAALAAMASGALWVLFTRMTHYEIGWGAIGVGALAGVSAVAFARGCRGRCLQVVAAISAVTGVAIGRFSLFYLELKAFLLEEFGVQAAASTSVFSTDVWRWFVQSPEGAFDAYFALWLALAAYTAWRIPEAASRTDMAGWLREDRSAAMPPRRDAAATRARPQPRERPRGSAKSTARSASLTTTNAGSSPHAPLFRPPLRPVIEAGPGGERSVSGEWPEPAG